MQVPTLEELQEDIEALRREAAHLSDDSDAIDEHLAKLRMLAVYLNAHLLAPIIPEA